MTINEARDILALLGPMLEDPTRWTCAIQDGRLAVILLDEPANLTRADYATALRVRDALDNDSLLVVL